jgi:hypothetical protein
MSGLKRALLLVILSCLLTCANILFCQAVSGTINGYVYDSSDAVVAGANVTIRNVSTGAATTRVTDADGLYIATNLLPGTYSVTIEAVGFRRFLQENVVLRIDSAVRVDAHLDLGAVTEQVIVSGVPSVLKTEKTDVGQYIPEQQLKELPTFGRNLSKLYNTIPGVIQNSFQIGAGENPSEFNGTVVHGQFFGNSEYEIDGITNTACCFSGFQVIVPNQDSVQEMKVTTAAYDPEYGASAGMVAQYVTQSGTNRFHGSVFEFNRNRVTFAADPFTEKLPNTGKDGKGFGVSPFNWNQFGFSAGGPIRQNKMFVFGDYQGTRARQGAQRTSTVPNNAFRNGDFSSLAVPIYDPLTGDAAFAGRTQFPGNRIPASRINPVARNLLSILPSANLSQATDVNFVGGGTVLQDTNQWDVRYDYNISDKDKVFARYTYFGSHLDNPPVFGKEAGGLAVGSLSPQTGDYRSQQTAVNYTRTITPTLLSEVRLGFIRFRLDGFQSDAGLMTNDKVGIPGINSADILTQGLAGINVQGPVGAWFMGILSGVGIPRLDRTTAYQGVNNWTHIRGNHQFRWGADIRRNRFDFIAVNASTRGNFVFAPAVTGANEVPGSGLGMATFLLGMPSAFDRAVLRGYTSELMWRNAFYWQDIWRITPKLTFNYGLRYDYIGPDTARLPGGLVNFDLTTGELLLAGLGDISNSANVKSDLNNFAPRVGLAYQLTSKSVIRAGFGRSYFISNYGGGFYFLTSTYPIATQQTIPQANIRSAVFPIENGPPPSTLPEFPSSGRLKAPPGQLLKSRPYDNKSEFVDSWNLTVEHQLANNLRVSVAYVGNVGRQLWRTLNVNAAQPGIGPLLDRRPYYGPFGLNTTIQNGCNCENSSYHALESVVEKRFSQGYSVNSALTWSKAIDARGAPNPAFRQSGRGLSEFDRAFSWVLSHLWELPYGPGMRWGSSSRGIARIALAGWKFSGITSFQSGFPFTPVLSNNATLNADFTQRPDIIGDYHVAEPDRSRWYNPAAFAAPQCCRLGNAGTNIIRGPRLVTADWAFGKDFIFAESRRLEFRWENFNFFNHANLALPVNQVDSPTAGRILGLAGSQTFGGAGTVPMRRMQFGLRFKW